MRINKYLAQCGIDSRRNCENYILSGLVSVNGTVVKELSYQIDENFDSVSFNGKIIGLSNKFVYYLLNKPKGVVCAVKPTKNEKTVVDLIKTNERIYPVGRLDKDTEGLLILTNDGELTQILTHPKYEKTKIYSVKINGFLTDSEIKLLEDGIPLDDIITSAAFVDKIKRNKFFSEFEITIHEGKNRQIRRMCEYIGHRVLNLVRIQIDDIKLNNLNIGEYRLLTEKEIKKLKANK